MPKKATKPPNRFEDMDLSKQMLKALLSAHLSSGSFLEEPVVDGGISQLIREQRDDYKSRKIGPYRKARIPSSKARATSSYPRACGSAC